MRLHVSISQIVVRLALTARFAAPCVAIWIYAASSLLPCGQTQGYSTCESLQKDVTMANFNKNPWNTNGSNDPIMDKILDKHIHVILTSSFWHLLRDPGLVAHLFETCCSRRWRSRHGLPSVETHGRRNRSLGPGGQNWKRKDFFLAGDRGSSVLQLFAASFFLGGEPPTMCEKYVFFLWL